MDLTDVIIKTYNDVINANKAYRNMLVKQMRTNTFLCVALICCTACLVKERKNRNVKDTTEED